MANSFKNQQLILEEVDECDYNPTVIELNEYAKAIGIDIEKESYLMYIAVQGIRAPLPEKWRACQTTDGKIYFFNFSTGESRWDHPCDEVYKNLVSIERFKRKKNGPELVIDEFVMNECISEENTDSGCSANVDINRSMLSKNIFEGFIPENDVKNVSDGLQKLSTGEYVKSKKFEYAKDVSRQYCKNSIENEPPPKPKDITSPSGSDIELISKFIPVMPKAGNYKTNVNSLHRFRSKKYRVGDSDIDLIRTDAEDIKSETSIDQFVIDSTKGTREVQNSTPKLGNYSVSTNNQQNHNSGSIECTDALQVKISSLESTLAEKDVKIKSLSDYIMSLEKEISSYKGEVNSLRSAIYSMAPLRSKVASTHDAKNTHLMSGSLNFVGEKLELYGRPLISTKRAHSLYTKNRNFSSSDSNDITNNFMIERIRRRVRKRRHTRTNSKPKLTSQTNRYDNRYSWPKAAEPDSPVIALKSSRLLSRERLLNEMENVPMLSSKFNSNPYLLASYNCNNVSDSNDRKKQLVTFKDSETNMSDVSDCNPQNRVISCKPKHLIYNSSTYCMQVSSGSSGTDTPNREIRIIRKNNESLV